MSKIPTAKEIFLKHSLKKENEIHSTTMFRYEQALREFASLHVKAALETAYRKHEKIRVFPAQFKELQGFRPLIENLNIERQLILNVYPDSLIQ